MPTWNRNADAKPRMCTIPRFPEGLSTWGITGKGQQRGVINMGREWQEIYPVLQIGKASVGELLANIDRGLREKTVWDIDCPFYTKRGRLGTGGGSVTVAGGGQTGSTLSISGGASNFLLAGDIIKVAGCAVIFDVTAPASSGSIPINPPIFSGQSPSSGAAVTYSGTILFKAVLVAVQAVDIDLAAGLVAPGLQLTFREQPQ